MHFGHRFRDTLIGRWSINSSLNYLRIHLWIALQSFHMILIICYVFRKHETDKDAGLEFLRQSGSRILRKCWAAIQTTLVIFLVNIRYTHLRVGCSTTQFLVTCCKNSSRQHRDNNEICICMSCMKCLDIMPCQFVVPPSHQARNTYGPRGHSLLQWKIWNEYLFLIYLFKSMNLNKKETGRNDSWAYICIFMYSIVVCVYMPEEVHVLATCDW